MQAPGATHERAILFSGHMIDAPDRARPRFPPHLEPAAARAICEAIDRLAASPRQVGICSGACGGDILFAEAMLERGVPLRLYLPFDPPTFMERSVNFADDRWPQRFLTVTARAHVFIATEVLGPTVQEVDPFERTNCWMLDEARRIGQGDVSLICLWNGEGGDGPGGTKHMMDVVRADGGRIEWIDIRTL